MDKTGAQHRTTINCQEDFQGFQVGQYLPLAYPIHFNNCWLVRNHLLVEHMEIILPATNLPETKMGLKQADNIISQDQPETELKNAASSAPNVS